MSLNQKPNILWICTDQQRFDTLGCYGNKYVKTPNIDNLACNGVRFEYAYSQSPVCSPSRAAFMTGRYPRTTRCRQNGQMIPADEMLISRIFADNGYNCGLSGKLHLAPCHADVCKTTEKRINDGYSVFNWSHHSQDYGNRRANWANNEYHVWLKEQGHEYKSESYNGSPFVQVSMPEELHQTTWCVNKAISFINANETYGNPWFFSVNIYDPHHPFDPPKEYLERYIDIIDELPMPNFIESELDDKPLFQRREFKNGAYNNNEVFRYENMNEYDHKLIKAAYWSMIDLIDKQVGRLIDALEKSNQLENTIIIFTSDHGEMLGDHGIYMKGPHFYDCSVRVPLIISWKGRTLKNVQSNALVELVDLAPTLLEASDLPIYEGMQGKSLWKLLTGESDIHTHKADVMAEYLNAMPTHKEPTAFLTMLRDERYKIVCCHGEDTGELYDMLNDPNETNNLWFNEEYAKIKYRLIKRLCDRIAFTCDPLPVRQAGY